MFLFTASVPASHYRCCPVTIMVNGMVYYGVINGTMHVTTMQDANLATALTNMLGINSLPNISQDYDNDGKDGGGRSQETSFDYS